MNPPSLGIGQAPPYFVAIGASGEGLRDIEDLLSHFPENLDAVVLVVLHRPSNQVSWLREALARSSRLPVLIPDEDERFRVGRCYIGDPDAHLSLAEKSRVRLVEGADHKHRGRTVDILFNSLAAHAKARGVGVVLSGSLDDGSRGLEAISDAGGVTMVLTRGGRAQPGMPNNAATFDGPIDVMGSAEEIAFAIVGLIGASTGALPSPAPAPLRT